MSATWSQEQVLFFLETLQSERVIWDPNDRGHKHRKKINDAWMRIQGIFNMHILELKKKKESLFANYRGYCRKLQGSLKCGTGVDDVYLPVWFAFEYMDSFFGPVFKCKQTMSTDTETVPNELEEENEAAESTDSSILADTLNSCEVLDPTPTQNKTIRRRLNLSELQIASKQMFEAFNNLNKMINRQDGVEDECDIFGKLIAKKLKKMPEHEREEIMFDIHALFRRPCSVDRSPVDSLRSSTLTCRNYSNVTMTSPRPHSSFSEPPNSFVAFSNGTDRQYILHIPESNENISLNENSSMVHIIRDEVVRPADTTQTRFVPDQTSAFLNNIISHTYYKSK